MAVDQWSDCSVEGLVAMFSQLRKRTSLGLIIRVSPTWLDSGPFGRVHSFITTHVAMPDTATMKTSSKTLALWVQNGGKWDVCNKSTERLWGDARHQQKRHLLEWMYNNRNSCSLFKIKTRSLEIFSSFIPCLYAAWTHHSLANVYPKSPNKRSLLTYNPPWAIPIYSYSCSSAGVKESQI